MSAPIPGPPAWWESSALSSFLFSPSSSHSKRTHTRQDGASDDPTVRYNDNDDWPTHAPVGDVLQYGLVDEFMREWLLRQQELHSGEITREEYLEWKLNWPETCDDSKNLTTTFNGGKQNSDKQNRPAEFVIQQGGFAVTAIILLIPGRYKVVSIQYQAANRQVKKSCIHVGFAVLTVIPHSIVPHGFGVIVTNSIDPFDLCQDAVCNLM